MIYAPNFWQQFVDIVDLGAGEFIEKMSQEGSDRNKDFVYVACIEHKINWVILLNFTTKQFK